ncbi:MAG TPA: hypothetical protein QGF58_14770 [Myxococcota bacterium]|nr:hypothetical protein [Myxococcota bacterium]
MLLFLLAAAPSKHRLAAAVEAYLAGDMSSVEELEALHAERPLDDEVALWLAIARVESRRCAEGAALLKGRSPDARGAAWRGMAARCLGRDPQPAFEEAYGALLPTDPLRRRVASGLGLAVLDTDPARAAALLAEGGGDPREHFSDAPDVLGLPGLPDLLVSYGGQRWRIREGLARPTSEVPPGCGLSAGPEGVYQDGELLLPAPADSVDVQARCSPSGDVWLLRHGSEGAVLHGPDLIEAYEGIVRFDVGEELVVASFLVGSEVRLARLSGGETVYYDSPLTLTDPEFPD